MIIIKSNSTLRPGTYRNGTDVLTAEEKQAAVMVWVNLLLLARSECIVTTDKFGVSQAANFLSSGLQSGARCLVEHDKCSEDQLRQAMTERKNRGRGKTWFGSSQPKDDALERRMRRR